jgi:hypothetical protein
MTAVLKTIVWVTLPAVLFLAVANVAGRRGVVLAQQRTNTPVMVTRVYTGADGLTHAEETTVSMTRGAGVTDRSPSVPITSVQLRRTAPNYFRDWHTPSRRHYVVTLYGRQNIGLSDGTTVRTYPGHVLLLEDLTGKGHTERGIGIDDHVAALLELPLK